MFAVNIADWQSWRDDFILSSLLASVTPNHKTVECERQRFDGIGVIFECDDERSEAIVQLIRRKLKKYELRLYRGSGKTWRRV